VYIKQVCGHGCRTSGDNFNLLCLIREELIKRIHEAYPGRLSRMRAELVKEGLKRDLFTEWHYFLIPERQSVAYEMDRIDHDQCKYAVL
jgi:hypothetical protein